MDSKYSIDTKIEERGYLVEQRGKKKRKGKRTRIMRKNESISSNDKLSRHIILIDV